MLQFQDTLLLSGLMMLLGRNMGFVEGTGYLPSFSIITRTFLIAESVILR